MLSVPLVGDHPFGYDGSKNTVYEASGAIAAEQFGQFYSLIDGHFHGGMSPDGELESSYTQDVSVYDGHLIQGPFGSIGLDQGIQFHAMLQNALHQESGEVVPGFRKGFISKALLQHCIGIVTGNIHLKQSLQSHDPSATTDFHWTSILKF